MNSPWDVPTLSATIISARANPPRDDIVSLDLFQYNFTNVFWQNYLCPASIFYSLLFIYLGIHFTYVSLRISEWLPSGIAHSFATFVTSSGTEILDHARELNRSTLSKVAVATDNGKSKSYRLSLSSAQWRRGGSSSARCCMSSYVSLTCVQVIA